MRIKNIDEKYYILLFISYIIFVFVPQFKVGVIATLVCILMFMPRAKIIHTDTLYIVFLLWAIFSFVFIDFSVSRAMYFYVKKIEDFIIPTMFYIMGQRMTKNSQAYKFYKATLVALIICFVSGVVWYVFLPEHYMQYMYRMHWAPSREVYAVDPRFNSFIGSISVGAMSNCGIAIAFTMLRFSKKRERKYWVFAGILMVIMCVLSMQRSGYVIMVLIGTWMTIKYVKVDHLPKIFMISIVVVSFLLIFINMNNIDIMSFVVSRVKGINVEMVTGRANQWNYAIEGRGLRFWIGSGLGQCTYGGKLIIADGAYFNILGELGLIGLFLFLLIVLKACLNYITIAKEKTLPMMIVFIFMLNAVGSNCIVYLDTAPLFWFSLGVLNIRYSLWKNIDWRRKYETAGTISTPISRNSRK